MRLELLVAAPEPDYGDNRGGWSEVMRAGNDQETAERLREATYSGRPFGDEEFVSEMERRAGRELRPRRASPKPHAVKAASAA